MEGAEAETGLHNYPEVLTRPREDRTEDVASIHGLTFHDFKLRKELIMGILRHGYKQPSPIQEEVIPAILAGKSVVARAKNGIGKTAAFAIPLIELCDLKDESIQTLILVPTRELAAQHQQEISFLSQYIPGFVKPLLLVGGVSVVDDVYRLKEKPHIVICTPGRCLDLLGRGTLKLNKVRHVVLDEADKLLSDSFRDNINSILAMINKPVPVSKGNNKAQQLSRNTFRKTSADDIVAPTDIQPERNNNNAVSQSSNADSASAQGGARGTTATTTATKQPQMLLFSATLPQSLSSFVEKIPNCQKITIKYGGSNSDSSANINQLVITGVTHHYLMLNSEKDKVSALMWLFQNIEIHQSFIFVRSKERAERLCSVLREYIARQYGADNDDVNGEGGTPFAVLHSGMSTENRLAALNLLRSGKVRHLITTDVGTRGLDSSLVNVVINFDMPDGGSSEMAADSNAAYGTAASKDYLHRIGRAGRFGGKGKAISFVVNDMDPQKPGELSADLVLLFKIERDLGIKINQITGSGSIE